MKGLGLRERLLLFYALTALLPVVLSGSLLHYYLQGQMAHSTERLQAGIQTELRQFQRTVETGVETALRDTQAQMRQRTAEQLQRQRERMQTEQANLLRDAVTATQTAARDALQQTEQQTRQNLNRTLQQVEQRVQAAQAQSLRALQREVAQATRNAVQQTITQHLTQLSMQLSRQVESLLRNYTAQLTLIAQQPAIQSGDLQASRWILQALQDREPAYLLLILLDAEGKPLLEIGDALDEPDAARAEIQALWEQVRTEQETVWGKARLYRVGGRLQPLVPLITPVRRMGKEFQGAVFALASLDELNALTRGFRLGEHGVVALAQQDGLILAHSDPKRVGRHDAQLQSLLSEARQPHSLLLRIDADEQLVAVAPVRRLNAALLIAQPADEAFQLADALQQTLTQQFALQEQQTRAALQQANRVAQRRFNDQTRQQQLQIRQRVEQAEQRALHRSVETLNVLAQTQQQALAHMIDESFTQTQRELQLGLATRLREASQRAQQQLSAVADEMRASVDTQTRSAFNIALMCVLAFLLLGGVFLHRTLVHPLRILVQATHDIAAGNLHRRVELPRRGCPDLDDLADSFNHMVDAVQKAEAQLIQSSKLASLGTLASGVAHELNQPLAIIRAIAQQNLEALENTPVPQLTAQLREDLQIVHRQTVRMSQIIQHLRAFARKPREEFEPVNLNEVAQNALILLREQLRQRGITLTEHYAADLPPVLGEANSLEQIVINLLTNARDALEGYEDGQITIETDTYDDGKQVYAELRVRDNGPGVPPDIRTQIFDPFFTTKDPNKGTGLGLAISLEIAQKHGGALLLGDTAQGAEFVLRVPVAAARQAAA
ncbi:MAG: ATP-binding protein [Fimbriimonadales bacterium]|nr:ATP-binding protein [Fimbriimonadales bacterium]